MGGDKENWKFRENMRMSKNFCVSERLAWLVCEGKAGSGRWAAGADKAGEILNSADFTQSCWPTIVNQRAHHHLLNCFQVFSKLRRSFSETIEHCLGSPWSRAKLVAITFAPLQLVYVWAWSEQPLGWQRPAMAKTSSSKHLILILSIVFNKNINWDRNCIKAIALGQLCFRLLYHTRRGFGYWKGSKTSTSLLRIFTVSYCL